VSGIIYYHVWSDQKKESKLPRVWQVKTLFLVSLIIVVCIAAARGDPERIVIGGLEGIDPAPDGRAPRIKLAISGGGARGIATVGILKALEERGIEVAAISGTSIGGVIGGLYACGYDAAHLAEIIRKIDFSALLSNNPERKSMFLTQRRERGTHFLSVRFNGLKPYIPQGLTSGQEVTEMLTSLTNRANYRAAGDFSRLPIPFKTIATDVVSGDRVIIDSGSLADAMRATIAFPLAFTGLDVGDQLLMDGGMVTPVPVDVVSNMADTTLPVVAVNTTSPLMSRSELSSPVDIANQVTSIMTADQLKEQLRMADLVIQPTPAGFSATDFRFSDTLIELGYQAGLRVIDTILQLVSQKPRRLHYRIDELRVTSEDRELADRFSAELLGQTMSRPDLIERLKSLYRGQSLFELSLELQTMPTVHSDSIKAVPVRLTIEPVERFSTDDIEITFEGNQTYSNDSLISLLTVGDSAFTVRGLKEGLERITASYHESGYDLAVIREVIPDTRNDRLIIRVDEGIIQRIDVRGGERTKDWLVRSYFPLQRGDPYSTEKATRGVTNIYATDLFDRVTLDLLPADSGVIVQIGVLEKKYVQMRLGWHWHDEYRSEQFLELLDDNVLGIGMEYLIHAQYGEDRQLYATLLRIHRIFFTYLTAETRFAYDRLDRVVYNNKDIEVGERKEERLSFRLGLGQQVARLGTVSGGLLIEELSFTDRGTGSQQKLGLRSLVFQSELESFDRVPFPRSGNKHLVDLKLAGKAVGGDADFTRLYSTLEIYLPFFQRLNYHPRVSIGFSRTGLPPSEKFYIGGSHSFSGYRTNQVSGDKVFLVNQELRLELPLNLYLFARFDLGDVYASTDQIKLKSLRSGHGTAIAWSSPIGPFEFGFGHADYMDRDNNEYYFNAGFRF
jgi:NTE family protein